MKKMTFAIMVMAGLMACNEEEKAGSPDKTMVQFGEDESLMEDEGAAAITIQFNQPAPEAGVISILVTTDFINSFQTVPEIVDGSINLDVLANAESVSFSITPVNNEILDESKSILFEIEQMTDGFEVGDKADLEIIIVDDEAPSVANFSTNLLVIQEKNMEEQIVSINLSGPAPGTGKIILTAGQSFEEGYFTTVPEMLEDHLVLDVSSGATEITFSVLPTNNEVINGNKSIMFFITSVEGALSRGDLKNFQLDILDDELEGKPKSYTTTGGGWSEKKTFEYDEPGRIKLIHWETRTPFVRTGTSTYYYAENGLIQRINEYPERDKVFIQENGRIVRSEVVDYGIKKSYSLYEYNDLGQIIGMDEYYRQPSGEYILGTVFVYEYKLDGNISRQLNYYPYNGSKENLGLISTAIYDNYYTNVNPFPMVEVVPTISSQFNLPGTYQFIGNGSNLTYYLFYEFNNNGMPIKRSVSGSGNDVTTYEYY